MSGFRVVRSSKRKTQLRYSLSDELLIARRRGCGRRRWLWHVTPPCEKLFTVMRKLLAGAKEKQRRGSILFPLSRRRDVEDLSILRDRPAGERQALVG